MSSKSFTSLRNPNWNWFMNGASPHEILQANYLNFDAYIVVEHDPWQRDHILKLEMHSLSKFPKVTLIFSKKGFKVIEQRWLMFQQKCEPNKGRAWQQNVDEFNLAEANYILIRMKLDEKMHLVDKTSKLRTYAIKLVTHADLWFLWLGLCYKDAS